MNISSDYFFLAAAFPFGLTALMSLSFVISFTSSAASSSLSGASSTTSSCPYQQASYPHPSRPYLEHFIVIWLFSFCRNLLFGRREHVALVKRNWMVGFVESACLSKGTHATIQTARGTADSLPGERGLDSRRYLLRNQLFFHVVHSQLHESVPIVLTKEVLVHILDHLFHGILVCQPGFPIHNM
jgi:hypothetical protein